MIIGISGKKGSGKDLSGAIIQALTNKPGTFDKMETVTEEDIMYKVWDVPTFKNIKFADKLKDIICLLLGCTREKLEEREYKETPLDKSWWYYNVNGKLFERWSYHDKVDNEICEKRYLVKTTPRLLLQLMGTECGRQILHPNVWVNAVMANYKGIYKGLPSEYVPGENLTYPNWVITDMRFPNEMEAVVEKEGITIRIARTMESYGVEHESETALDDATFDYYIDNSGTIKDLVKKIKEILIKEKII